ncbi:MAG TPA: hypothetical protein VHB79_25210 [Polyangiaceae bacterium]|nr:hypothetical protein [Polyangiaceae bacterium]
MSTRAIVAYVSSPGQWKGTWNHWNGEPQHLGQELIDRVATFDGDMERLVRQYVDRCPEGWSDFREGTRSEDPVGFVHGKLRADGASSVDDGIGLDTHYVYVFDLATRTLAVFNTSTAPVAAFGRVVFDSSGNPTPSHLPAIEELP